MIVSPGTMIIIRVCFSECKSQKLVSGHNNFRLFGELAGRVCGLCVCEGEKGAAVDQNIERIPR